MTADSSPSMPTKKPGLFLLPNLLGESRHHTLFLPESVDRAVASLDGLISESEQAGRRYLSLFKHPKPVHQIPIALFNKHTPKEDIDFLLEPIKKGERWGLISDAGLPCIADPGHLLVARARQLALPIQAFVGPSSLMIALMLSGLPAQRFAFHGYLNREKERAAIQLKQMEQHSLQKESTELFMETPYRNQEILILAVETLAPETQLCVAWNLTLPDQGVICQSIKVWKKSQLPNLDKKPAIFLIAAVHAK